MTRLTPRTTGILRMLATLLLAAVLSACRGDLPEQVLRATLDDLQKSVEEGRVQDAMGLVAEDFSGPRGMDRGALHNLLRMQVLGGRRVGVTTTPFQIALKGDTATVTFDVVLTGTGQGRWMPDSAQSYAVTTGWRFSGDDWTLYYADWQANR